MSSKQIGVGIVGASPEGSWAAMSHVPALQALPEYRLVAVSTTRMETATAAAEAFGAEAAFDNHAELIAHPEVDLVVVAVRVPYHRDIVLAALDAGKHVYCEWPLGHGLAESIELCEAEKRSAGRGFIGTQATSAPAFRYLADLVRDGYVGEIRSVSIVASGMAWGGFVDTANLYSVDAKVGASILTIPFGHAMAALDTVMGLPVEVSGRIEHLRKEAVVVESGETVPMTNPDQLLVQGVLANGAPVSVHYRGGMSRGTNMLLEINGTQGDIVATGFCGHVQMFPVSLSGGRGEAQQLEPLPVPESYQDDIALEEGFALGIAHAYRRVARDILEGASEASTFDEALRVHRLIDAIERSAASGYRERV